MVLYADLLLEPQQKSISRWNILCLILSQHPKKDPMGLSKEPGRKSWGCVDWILGSSERGRETVHLRYKRKKTRNKCSPNRTCEVFTLHLSLLSPALNEALPRDHFSTHNR